MNLGIIDIIGMLLIVGGIVFFLGASVGLLRFPDFYTRMHAAGKGDTLSTLMILAGLALFALNQFGSEGAGVILVAVKILAIGALIILTSPASTHALMKAGFEDNVEPVGEGDEMQIEMPPLGNQVIAEALPASAKSEQPPSEPKVAKKAAKKKTAAKKTSSKKKASAKKIATKKTTSKKSTTKKKSAKKATAKKKTPAKKKSPTKKNSASKKSTSKKKAPTRRKKD